jgi:signal transduction histidine kinase
MSARLVTIRSAIAPLLALWGRFTEPHPTIVQPDARRDAKLIINLVFFLMVPVPIVNTMIDLFFVTSNPNKHLFIAAYWLVPVLLYPTYRMARSPKYRRAAAAIIGFMIVMLLLFVAGLNTAGEERMFIYSLFATLIAGAFFSVRTAALVTLIMLVELESLRWLGIHTNPVDLESTAYAILNIGALSLVLAHHRNLVERDRHQMLTRLNDELRLQRDHLATNKARDDAILTSMRSGLFAISPDGLIILVNAKCQEWLGADQEAVVGTPMHRWMRFEDEVTGAQILDAAHVSAVLGGQASGVFPQVVLTATSGAQVPVLIGAAPIVRKGRTVGVVFNLTDRTEAKALDEAKNNFIGTAGHELRTPFTAARGAIDLLESERDQLPEGAVRFVDMAAKANRQMGEVIHKLIRMTEVQTGDLDAHLETGTLSALIDPVLNKYRTEIEAAGLALIVKRPKAEVRLHTNLRLAAEIVEELVNNALRFTASGAITVRAYRGSARNKIIFRGNFIDAGHHLIVEVRDTGRGIGDDSLQKIYGSFVQEGGFLHRQQDIGGMGMGLFIVKQIADRIGSAVWFRSRKGKGSSFYVSFPLAEK